MRIVDAHMHVWQRGPAWRGRETPERAYGRVVLDGTPRDMMPPAFVDGTSPPDVAVAYLDRWGVERGVLVQEWLEGFLNDQVAAAVAAYPDRFVGEALLDPTDADSAKELDRRLGAGELHGLKVPVGSLRRLDPHFEVDAPMCLRWLEICAAHGAFVTIHPQRGPEAAEAMRRVAERYESVRFLLAHMGMPDQAGWDRVLDLCRLPNVWMDISAVPFVFGEPFPCPRSQVVLQESVRRVGAEKFLWGSDYPRTLTDLTYGQMLDWVRVGCPDLDEAQKAQILGRNALRVCWREV